MKHLFVALLCTITAYSYSQNLSDSFGFESDLKTVKFWNFKSINGQIVVVDDKAFDGKAWCLTGSGQNFHTFIYAYFNLSEKADNIEIYLHSLSKNIDKAWLKLWCLDVQENILKRDSISLQGKNEWQQNILRILSPGTEKIYIEIEAKSKKQGKVGKTIKSELMIDNMNLIIDGNKIKPKPKEVVSDNKFNSNLDIIPDSLIEKKIKAINNFSGCRIIALGESMHGSGTISQCAFSTIKHLIQEQNCRLVLFEINFELGLWFNEYVTSNTDIEEIKRRLVGYNFDFRRLFDLLDWIKKYNKNTDEKVSVLGIDIYIPMLNIAGFDHLSDLFVINKKNCDSIQVFSDLCKRDEFEQARYYLIRNNFWGIENTTKRRCILWALKQRQEQDDFHPLLLYNRGTGKTLIEGDRELIQFQNTRFAVDSLLHEGENAVIYAHLGHVNKGNIFGGRLYVPSLGHYLNQYYKNDYHIIALLVGNGTYSNTDVFGNFNSFLPLQAPEKNSIEDLFLDMDVSFKYIKTEFLDEIYSGRSIGMLPDEKQFYPYSKNRFDAVMFLQHGKGYELPMNWPNNRKELIKFLNKQRTLNGHQEW